MNGRGHWHFAGGAAADELGAASGCRWWSRSQGRALTGFAREEFDCRFGSAGTAMLCDRKFAGLERAEAER